MIYMGKRKRTYMRGKGPIVIQRPDWKKVKYFFSSFFNVFCSGGGPSQKYGVSISYKKSNYGME